MQTIELHWTRPGDDLKKFLACKLFLDKKKSKMQTMDLHLTQPGDGWKMEFFARKQLKLKIAKKIPTMDSHWD